MPDKRQFLAVRFDGSTRPYTYHNDGPPCAVGDRVRVKTGRTKPVTVTVAGILRRPGFATKPILGRVEDTPQQESDDDQHQSI
jgi:hypothetical protein